MMSENIIEDNNLLVNRIENIKTLERVKTNLSCIISISILVILYIFGQISVIPFSICITLFIITHFYYLHIINKELFTHLFQGFILYGKLVNTLDWKQEYRQYLLYYNGKEHEIPDETIRNNVIMSKFNIDTFSDILNKYNKKYGTKLNTLYEEFNNT